MQIPIQFWPAANREGLARLFVAIGHRLSIMAACRQLVNERATEPRTGFTANKLVYCLTPEIEISIEDRSEGGQGHVCVRVRGAVVAAEFTPSGQAVFEHGDWVNEIERASAALPLAA